MGRWLVQVVLFLAVSLSEYVHVEVWKEADRSEQLCFWPESEFGSTPRG